MKQNDFYEVDGYTDFIPVTINETYADGVGVTVDNYMQGYRLVVKEVYRFPKTHEPKKPVIPKYVAEWIDTLDEHGLFGLNYDVVDESVWNWVYENYDCNVKKLHLAYLYGYEVEKERLYTVEIPNPNIIGKERTVLMKNGFNQIVMLRGLNDNCRTVKGYQLTESEIKQDFEWAWDAGFAKEVVR